MFRKAAIGVCRFVHVPKCKTLNLYGNAKDHSVYSRRDLFVNQSLCARTRKRTETHLSSTVTESSAKSYSLEVPMTGPEVEAQVETVKHQLVQANQLRDIPPNDKLFKSIVLAHKVKKHRMKKNSLLLEGKQLITAAISSGLQLEYLFYSKDDKLSSLEISDLKEDRILKVKDKTLRMLSGDAISPGIVGICKKPAVGEMASVLPVTILCSSIRDPSNLAVMISTAVAAGCKSVCLTKGCADVWERKVLNSAGGAHFHIPIYSNIDWSDVKTYIPEGCAFYLADGSADIDLVDSQIYTDVTYGESTLNDDENVTLNFLEGHHDNIVVSPNGSNEQSLQECVNYNLPCHLYCTKFPHKDIVLYIGGETGGIDAKIEQLASEIGGQKLKIPLENEMDSLNVCSALSIILFEIKRQFVKNSVVMKN